MSICCLFEETTRGKELRHQRSQDGAVTWTAQSVIRPRRPRHRRPSSRDGSTDSRLWTNGCGAVDDAGHLRLGRGSTCHGHLDRRRPNLAPRVQSGRRRFTRRPLVSRVGRRREGHLPGLLARRPRRRTRSARRLIARWRMSPGPGTSRSPPAPASAAGTNRLFRVPIPSLSCIGTRAPATWRSQRPSMGGRTWSRRGTVGAFNWAFDGCPHVGGGIARTADQTVEFLHATVWTGATGRVGAHVLKSPDGGVSWGEPTRLGSERAKHTDWGGVRSDAGGGLGRDANRAESHPLLGRIAGPRSDVERAGSTFEPGSYRHAPVSDRYTRTVRRVLD